MALWIRVNNGAVITEHVFPENGKSFTLEELQHFVGGYIEALKMNDGRIMWLNEEGKQDELPYNPVADLIAQKQTGIAWDDGIVGDVVIATKEESGEAGPED